MRSLLAGISAAAMLVVAGAAQATIVTGAFSGMITGGVANGNFGYAGGADTDLTGQAIHGTFRYDTALLGGPCSVAQSFFGCFLGTGMTITETVNGVTTKFGGTPAADTGQEYDTGVSGLALYNLVGAAANLHTHTMLGTPATVYDESETGLSFGMPAGAIPDANDPVVVYDGASSETGYAYNIDGQIFSTNHTQIYQLTGGFFTELTSFDFTVDQVSFSIGAAAPAPEPASWALMIAGFGGVGAVLRRRRQSPVFA